MRVWFLAQAARNPYFCAEFEEVAGLVVGQSSYTSGTEKVLTLLPGSRGDDDLFVQRIENDSSLGLPPCPKEPGIFTGWIGARATFGNFPDLDVVPWRG